MRKRLLFKFDLCTGCRICELACSFEKEGFFHPGFARLRLEPPSGGLFNDVTICVQCDNPACQRVCPTGAITRDPQTQAVILNRTACNGCGICLQYCHLKMVILPPGLDRPVKCDHCAGEPACVRLCPTKALIEITLPEGL